MRRNACTASGAAVDASPAAARIAALMAQLDVAEVAADCPVDSSQDPGVRRVAVAKWKEIVAKYQQPHAGRASWQIINTIGAYAVAWYLIWLSLSVSWWLTLPMAILAGGLLVRVFIIFHDCGHGSFFASRV